MAGYFSNNPLVYWKHTIAKEFLSNSSALWGWFRSEALGFFAGLSYNGLHFGSRVFAEFSLAKLRTV
jgi:hypothetical protein